MIFRNKNIHFDPRNCKLKIGNVILERIGADFTNKYFKFVGRKNAKLQKIKSLQKRAFTS